MAGNTAEEYLAAFSPDRRAVLERLRTAIKEAAPGAVEAFSYQMPGFKYRGRSLIWFAGWKNHYSLYPLTPAMREAHSRELDGFEQSKGTIRFPAGEPLPLDLIARLIRTRVAEIDRGGR